MTVATCVLKLVASSTTMTAPPESVVVTISARALSNRSASAKRQGRGPAGRTGLDGGDCGGRDGDHGEVYDRREGCNLAIFQCRQAGLHSSRTFSCVARATSARPGLRTLVTTSAFVMVRVTPSMTVVTTLWLSASLPPSSRVSSVEGRTTTSCGVRAKGSACG